MNEEDYKSLIATYQRKSMDLFAQLVVAETKVEVLNTQLRDAKSRIQQLEEEIKSMDQMVEEIEDPSEIDTSSEKKGGEIINLETFRKK